LEDLLENPLRLSEDHFIWKAQDRISAPLQVPVSIRIVSRLRRYGVDSAVQLYDEPKPVTAEVRNEIADGKLPSELEALEPSMAEQLP
jgi:hypothetical protein